MTDVMEGGQTERKGRPPEVPGKETTKPKEKAAEEGKGGDGRGGSAEVDVGDIQVPGREATL